MESWDIRNLDVEPHKPVVLRSSDEARAIAIHLPGGEEMQEHRTHEAAYVVVVDGEVEIEQGESSTSGAAGFVAYFDANEDRRILARSDARLLLVLGPWPGQGHPSRHD
ncbi:MAG: cupin domain-containing protein [Thermoleophilaceae bacterium]|nr:cupin domain-containing protein [Thermoleophilaceae bacterium]MBA3840310.1 cupin domain-containing protein [Thermoleophilaceae bacterium]